MINVGANSGSNVNEFLLQYNIDWAVSPKKWHALTMTGCGVCGACKESVKDNRQTTSSVEVIAVEMMKPTFLRMRAAFDTFGVPGLALHLAVGAKNGIVYEPATIRAGTEHLGVQRKGVPVPMRTVDSIMRMHPFHRSGDTVDFLSIDTEGNDARVLMGAIEGLKRRAFRVVEFEYHGVGDWQRLSLNQTVTNIGAFGYRCYWQGSNGRLMRFRFDCNNEVHRWSNLVCTHEPRIARILDGLS